MDQQKKLRIVNQHKNNIWVKELSSVDYELLNNQFQEQLVVKGVRFNMVQAYNLSGKWYFKFGDYSSSEGKWLLFFQVSAYVKQGEVLKLTPIRGTVHNFQSLDSFGQLKFSLEIMEVFQQLINDCDQFDSVAFDCQQQNSHDFSNDTNYEKYGKQKKNIDEFDKKSKYVKK